MDPSGVLELLTETGQTDGDGQKGKRHAPQSKQEHDSERAMMACVTKGSVSPTRLIIPSGSTNRSHPSAGSHDGRSSTSHMPPITNRRPGRVVRAANHAMGKPTTSPKTAAALLTQSELSNATAVLPVKAPARYER